jgi:hypothetical protein
MLRVSTSADSRLAASSKVVRVRVLASKNRLTTVLPCRVGSFLTPPFGDPAQRFGGVENLGQMAAG